MEPVNREAYGATADKLVEFARDADAARVMTVADEVLAVADLLRRERRLRRVLSDPARSGTDRRELLRTVLSGKIGEDALDLLGTLVSARWTTPGALLTAVERLGVDALLTGADRAGELADLEDELFRFSQIVSGDNRLAAALGDSSADVARRAELLRDLLDGKVKPATLRLAQLALAGFGGRGLTASLIRMVELAAAKRDQSVAYVTSAVPLTDADEQRLAGRLSEMYGRDVAVKIDVDPKIIGGMRVKVGSDLYDGTIARRLAEARTAFAK